MPELAARYPAARPDWSMDEVWPVARAFLARERAAVAEFIRSAPQTNETRRSIALLAGFLAFAHAHAGPDRDARDRRERGAQPALGPLRLSHRARGRGAATARS